MPAICWVNPAASCLSWAAGKSRAMGNAEGRECPVTEFRWRFIRSTRFQAQHFGLGNGMCLNTGAFFIAVFSLPGKLHCLSSFGYFCNREGSNLALFMSLNARLSQDVRIHLLRLSCGALCNTRTRQLGLLPFTSILNQIFSWFITTLGCAQPLAAK